MDLCDRVSVMKNGKLIGTERVEDVTEDDILSMIILGKNPRRGARRRKDGRSCISDWTSAPRGSRAC
jgi:ABC-type sugar transport system ATPase subunit